MAITVNNLNSMMLLHILNRTSTTQTNTLTQLSTGSRINAGRDDPAGLIAMRSLETELRAVDASISNNERTNAMLNVADKAVNEVASLINEIKELAIASANEDGISASELAANQAQVDSALEAIDQIIGTTQFNGKKLLDGSFGIQTSGVTAADLTDLKVYSREDTDLSVTVELQQAASAAVVSIAAAVATDDTAINILGKEGSVVIEIASGEALSAVAAKINAATAQTGVTASASAGDLSLLSSDYGEDAFVRVTVVDRETADASFSDQNDTGVDAQINVNGQAAAVDGKAVNYSANGVSFSFNITDAFNESAVGTTSAFTVSADGGATFQLGTTAQTRQTIGIDALYTHMLGHVDYGYLDSLAGGRANSLIDDPNAASQIATKAAEQLGTIQGRIGGFQKFQVETALNQQTATKESLSAALSTIKDVDYAEATAELNRQSVLMQAAMSLLGLANQQSAQVLSLLG
jgi:flagellin-like hook-associated protein FlgL